MEMEEGSHTTKELKGDENGEYRSGPPTYCVTGANGCIGSWLVKLLLEKGYKVHATVRDPAKVMHLLSLWPGGDRLRLFRADLQEGGSFDEPIKSCDGVFHVAASMEFDVPEVDNLDNYVNSIIIDPAINGTLNLLRSCSKSKTVKRVVFTSSISTLTARDSLGEWRQVVDETCRTPVDQVWNTKASGWVYALSKLLSEEAAFKYAKENCIDLISVITTTVAGPFLTLTVPSSIQVLLSPITGDSKFYSILSAVNARMGSIALVHVEDISNAHLFLMEQSRVQGRYISCTQSCPLNELIDRLAEAYPSPIMNRSVGERQDSTPPEISSEKLRALGFSYKYDIQDIIRDTVICCVDNGFLPSTEK